MKSSDRMFDILLVLSFLVSLFLPLATLRFEQASVSEKRSLAPFPQWPKNTHEIRVFQTAFEKWFDDHFGGRHRLVQAYHLMSLALGTTGSPRVLLGKDGWLFYTDPEDGNNLDDYRRTDPLTQDDLERWRLVLETKAAWLKSRGIAYFFIVVPNKHTIYPEYYSSRVRVHGVRSRLDQLMDALKDSDVPVLDLRKPFLEAKVLGRLYHKTDTHWNDLGAALAANVIVDKLFSFGLTAGQGHYRVEDFFQRSAEGGDLARMLNLSRILKEHQVPVVRPGVLRCFDHNQDDVLNAEDPELIITSCRSEGKSALIFRDSFFTRLRPFVSEHFRKAVYTMALPEIETLERLVKEYAPDVVLEERVERYLKVLPKAPDPDSEPYRAYLETRVSKATHSTSVPCP
ncbi:MAG: hypothetical protein WHS46_00215 [Desulfosoma sp.]